MMLSPPASAALSASGRRCLASLCSSRATLRPEATFGQHPDRSSQRQGRFNLVQSVRPKTTMSEPGFKGYERQRDSDARGGRAAAAPLMSPRALFALAAGVGGAWAVGEFWLSQRRAEEERRAVPNEIEGGGEADNASNEHVLAKAPPTYTAAVADKYPQGALRGVKKLTLYQYQTCPFCCKARAFLDYYGINHDVVEVNSVTRKQVKWSNYRKVPQMVAETDDGRFLRICDSVVIVSALASFIVDQKHDLLDTLSSYPKLRSRDEDGKEREEIVNKYNVMYQENSKDTKKRDKFVEDEKKWRSWTDKQLIHKISPNVYRTLGEALETFKWFDKRAEWDKVFNFAERYLVIYVGAVAMWLIAKRLKTKHHLKKDVRQSLYDDATELVRALKKRKSAFLGGSEPHLGDLAAYGAICSFEGCRAFNDMMENTEISTWFYAMKDQVESSRGQGKLHAGA